MGLYAVFRHKYSLKSFRTVYLWTHTFQSPFKWIYDENSNPYFQPKEILLHRQAGKSIHYYAKCDVGNESKIIEFHKKSFVSFSNKNG